ncbi:MAG: hypothetical protein WA776_00490 [Xanthobacteraceae bacterium]
MFSNAILDIASGLVFLYLVLSLLCTVVNEYIATNLLGLRAANLAAGASRNPGRSSGAIELLRSWHHRGDGQCSDPQRKSVGKPYQKSRTAR